jgi:hypothetical protein
LKSFEKTFFSSAILSSKLILEKLPAPYTGVDEIASDDVEGVIKGVLKKVW